MKSFICLTVGAVGSAIAGIFGGWDAAVLTLLIVMAIDYVTGLVVAGVFHKSPKTENGGIESKAGWKGLCKKGMVLALLLVAARLDICLGKEYISDAVCIGFILNEVISIIENAGLMGVPIPAVLTKAIDILKNKQGGAKTLPKIYLSPSSQWENKYKTGNTNEAAQCAIIAKACYNALVRCGFTVKLGDNKKTDMYDRCEESDLFKAGLHIPIHTNAANGKTTGGTQILSYETKGERLKIAKAIFNKLSALTPGTSAEKIYAQPDFYEIKTPKATTLYCECEFHDTKTGSDFIINNANVIGETICKGICDYYKVPYVELDTRTFTVSVSGVKTSAKAEALATSIKKLGYTPKVSQE